MVYNVYTCTQRWARAFFICRAIAISAFPKDPLLFILIRPTVFEVSWPLPPLPPHVDNLFHPSPLSLSLSHCLAVKLFIVSGSTCLWLLTFPYFQIPRICVVFMSRCSHFHYTKSIVLLRHRRRMEREAKTKVCLGDKIWSISCRASCFASVYLEETVEFNRFFRIPILLLCIALSRFHMGYTCYQREKEARVPISPFPGLYSEV